MGKMMSSVGAEYIEVWNRALTALFGWSDQGVAVWAAKFKSRMEAKGGIFFHEDAVYYILPLCIPSSLRKHLNPIQLNQLEADLDLAIKEPGSRAWRDDAFDWHEARHRVEQILEKYAESFPRLSEPS